MLANLYKGGAADARGGLDIVRIGVALIILMHPLHGYTHPEGLPNFGAFLEHLGYPFGTALAWSVITLQALCSVALIANRFVVPACIGHMVVICFGLVHVHYQYGWYVGWAQKGQRKLVFARLVLDRKQEAAAGGLRAKEAFLRELPARLDAL